MMGCLDLGCDLLVDLLEALLDDLVISLLEEQVKDLLKGLVVFSDLDLEESPERDGLGRGD